MSDGENVQHLDEADNLSRNGFIEGFHEHVLFFPALAHLDATGEFWHASVNGWVFGPRDGSRKRRIIVSLVRRAIGDINSELERNILARRLRAFMVDNLPGRRLRLKLGNLVFPLGTSRANGHFRGEVSIDARSVSSNTVDLAIENGPGRDDEVIAPARVYLLAPRGTSVISDIDDTVKVSNVLDRHELLANTFRRPFRAIPGMAQRYSIWASGGAFFHYVTASPWQLYIHLQEFLREAGFPEGSFHMKLFRFKDRTIRSLLGDPEEYKMRQIQDIIERFPERRFILVGDTGERDPWAYGEIARRFPGQVAGIFIRTVRQDDHGHRERFAPSMQGVPDDLWKLFREPSELPDRL